MLKVNGVDYNTPWDDADGILNLMIGHECCDDLERMK